MLLHCLYLHLFRENQEDRRLWNLACDIAVEQIISRERSRFWRQVEMKKKSGKKFSICLETARIPQKRSARN